jgi:ABC-2 type transport system ATP-binding protein
MLKLSEVSKSFGARQVLAGLDFQVAPGEIYGLLGSNGAGKSTTFNLVCGLLLPDAGEILVCGQPARDAPRGSLGVVTQQITLYRSLTCAENLTFFGKLYGLRGSALEARVKAGLEEVGLGERSASLVRDLSGGMQRRLHVAVGLVHQPSVILLDEPSAGIDVESRRELWELVRSLQAAGRSVLLATHLLDEAEALCTLIGILDAGRIAVEGTPEALLSRIPAVEIATVRSPAPAEVVRVAQDLGFQTRVREHDLVVWLPRRIDLSELIQMFAGAPIDSIGRRPVTLEDVYLEINKPDDAKDRPGDRPTQVA